MMDLPLAGRRVLIREDLNVPVRDRAVASDARLSAALPSIEFALQQGARVILMSHLGRPVEGRFDEAFSLRPVARRLGELLNRPIDLIADWKHGVEVEPGQAVLLENVRFELGEKADDPQLAARLAGLCDIFVMDAFGSAHRAHASTHGVARLSPVACAGPLLVRELEALAAALEHPQPPTAAIVGGSKVSTKLGVLRTLAGKVDTLILGGGIANTLLAAADHPVGRSLYEPDMLGFARRLLRGEFGPADIPLPSDVVVAESPDAAARGTTRGVDEVGGDEMILDIGPRTAAEYAGRLPPGRHHSLERAGGRLRTSRVRRWDRGGRQGRGGKRRFLDRRRRRHAGGDPAVRCPRGNFLPVHGRWRLSRIPRGQGTAGGCGAQGTGRCTLKSNDRLDGALAARYRRRRNRTATHTRYKGRVIAAAV